jgi:hypothetical protein
MILATGGDIMFRSSADAESDKEEILYSWRQEPAMRLLLSVTSARGQKMRTGSCRMNIAYDPHLTRTSRVDEVSAARRAVARWTAAKQAQTQPSAADLVAAGDGFRGSD